MVCLIEEQKKQQLDFKDFSVQRKTSIPPEMKFGDIEVNTQTTRKQDGKIYSHFSIAAFILLTFELKETAILLFYHWV